MRPAHFAGSWYPGTEQACRRAIEDMCSEAPAAAGRHGGVVPHAGWSYSGRAAVAALQALAAAGRQPAVVVVFGNHLAPVDSHTLMRSGAWETPLGPLPIASALAEQVSAEASFEEETEEHHRRDNGIELVLPLVRYFFPEVELLPVGVAPRPEAVEIGSAVAAAAAGLGLEAVFLGSTDLTHYGPNYGFTPRGLGPEAVEWVKTENDKGVVERMQALDGAGVLQHAREHRSACCPGAAAAAMTAARHNGATAGRLASYYTSHDVRPANSFVGYAGVVFE